MSSCGSSQYRILKKLLECKLQKFDHVLLVHTSPYRIYIQHNPLHAHSETHQHCDLIYNDVKNKQGSDFVNHVCWWFENAVDLDQCELVHQLLVKYSSDYLQHVASTHITFFPDCGLPFVHDFSQIYREHPGSINHMDEHGNRLVANRLNAMI